MIKLKQSKGEIAVLRWKKAFAAAISEKIGGEVSVKAAMGGTYSTCAGIDRKSGCIVIVRPDQYVAHVLPIDADRELADSFEGFMSRPAGRPRPMRADPA